MTDKERCIISPAKIPKTVSLHPLLRYLFVLLLFCAGLLFTLAIHAASAEADTGNNAASNLEPLVFLGNHRLPPMNYLENDQAKGLVVEIVEAMAARMERPVTIKLMDWAEAQELVLAGEAYALIQIITTEERELLYEFSEPLL
jgi:ABC-type amino acid transport substrate-binding protein